MRRVLRALLVAATPWMMVGLAWAGGGEVSEVGHGYTALGLSIKRGSTRFDENGDRYRARDGRTHDFRYNYLYFEVGVLPRLQAHGVLTYLDGCESFDPGTREPFCHDGGSDQWLGLKYQLLEGVEWPLAIEATARIPDVYMDDNETTRSGKHWLGVYRHDYTLLLHTSHSFSRAWLALVGGYSYREGAPASVVILRPQVRVPLAGGHQVGLTLDLAVDGYFSVGNEAPPHPERDRFGDRREEVPGHFFNFNDQDFVRPCLSLDLSFGGRWNAAIGYSKIVYGRSAHIYDEGWLQIGYRF